MRVLHAADESVRVFVVVAVLVAVAATGLGAGFGLANGVVGVGASHDDPDQIHACVSRVSGAMRYVRDPASCSRYEEVVSWNQSTAPGDWTIVRRTAINDVPGLAPDGITSVIAECEPGETALSGGYSVQAFGGPSADDFDAGDVNVFRSDKTTSGGTEGWFAVMKNNSTENALLAVAVYCAS